jgi:hypothetical protein
VWNKTGFEIHLRERLIEELRDERGGQRFSTYEVTRENLVNNIYQQIPRAEPNLSDHGPDHIANVLDNVLALLSDSYQTHMLSAIDLYVLAMGVLFHDVGNLHGRTDHHKNIGAIYDSARGTHARVRHEKALVMILARAHTGVAADGTHDTLKEVPEIDHLDGGRVHLRSIAAILRFADELAEGPQRTSEFLRRAGLYADSSKIYHEYASITNIGIDRLNQRILLTYEVDIDDDRLARDDCSTWLQNFLRFIYARIIKLDQERRYTRYYSDVLLPFKATQITFNFHCKSTMLPIDLKPLLLDDKVVPGEQSKGLQEIDHRYKIDELVNTVLSAARE